MSGVALSSRQGTIVDGKYVLDRLLGRGGMGEVWLAQHSTLKQPFALKLMAPRGATPETIAEARSRFELEARVMARLSRATRNIVAVTDYGMHGETPYLTMEMIVGESLEQRLDRDGPLDLPEVAEIVQQIAHGLSVAHAAGVIHRDLKPGNVMLSRDEEGLLVVKILDFGIARNTLEGERSKVRHRTRTGFVLGTPNYTSPEQALGASNIDVRCDLWALACVAYEAIAGKMPFEGVSLMEIFARVHSGVVMPIRVHRPDVAAELDEFFRRAFAMRIEDRYQDALPLAADLSRICRLNSGGPSMSAPPTAHVTTQTLPQLPLLRRAPAIAFAALGLLVLLVLVLAMGRRRSQVPSASLVHAPPRVEAVASFPSTSIEVATTPSQSPKPTSSISIIAVPSSISSTPIPRPTPIAPKAKASPSVDPSEIL